MRLAPGADPAADAPPGDANDRQMPRPRSVRFVLRAYTLTQHVAPMASLRRSMLLGTNVRAIEQHRELLVRVRPLSSLRFDAKWHPMASSKTSKVTRDVPLKTLVGLLGKSPKDPAVVAAMAKAGKVSFKSDFIVAKEAGFDFSLKPIDHEKRNSPKVLSSLFVFAEGHDGHQAYSDLPAGFTFTTRAELLGALPTPARSWKLGKGKVPVSTPDVLHDTWELEGLSISANYRKDAVRYLNISLSKAAVGQDFSTHPLHFETKPADAPAQAELVGMALLVAWSADRFGLPAKHAGSALGKQLSKRAISPRTFLVQACEGRISSLDLDPTLGDFIYEYLNQIIDDEGARKKADAAIAKLLNLDFRDDRSYPNDFLGTFAKVLESPYYVPDHWDAVDRIAPVIDARLADFRATHFEKAPPAGLYERAAKLRDKQAVNPERAQLAAPSADEALSAELVGMIGKSLKDPHVKAVLTRTGMPIGKKIDQQANPALGLAYMGSKFEIEGKHQLGVEHVSFFASKQKAYIRGIGAEVAFVGYPGQLPHGLEFGDTRQAVAKKLGKPADKSDDMDEWRLAPNRRLVCRFARGKLVSIDVGVLLSR